MSELKKYRNLGLTSAFLLSLAACGNPKYIEKDNQYALTNIEGAYLGSTKVEMDAGLQSPAKISQEAARKDLEEYIESRANNHFSTVPVTVVNCVPIRELPSDIQSTHFAFHCVAKYALFDKNPE